MAQSFSEEEEDEKLNVVPLGSFLNRYLSSSNAEDSVTVNFTLPPFTSTTVGLMSIFTTLLTVCGFFTNCIAIGILNAHVFDRMAFAVHMKILCLYNIFVLVLGSLQHNSFYLDIRNHTSISKRRYYCTYLLWFIQVFEHARTACIILILYNRIKAQGDPDVFLKGVEAVRFPILGNFLFFLVTTVYVSRYIDQLDIKTGLYNRTECIYSFMQPFRRETTADVLLSNMPFFEHTVILLMLSIFLAKVLLKSRSFRESSVHRSDSMSSTSPGQGNEMPTWPVFNQRGRPSDSFQLSSLLDFSEALVPVTNADVNVREFGVNTMTVVIVIINTITSGLRDAADSFMMKDLYPDSPLVASSFESKCLLDLLFYSYLASVLFIMYICSSHFSKASSDLLYNVDAYYERSGSSLGLIPRKQSHNIQKVQRADLQQLDPLTNPPGSRHMPSMMKKRSTADLDVTVSVWSLDKAYFLNTTKEYAIIENF